jgi:DNA-binding NarL/FixJ family response regulator
VIKVLIVDDIRILRECLSLAIEKQDEFEVVGCAADGKQAVEMTLRLNPDIVLMDLYMPVYSGCDAIRDIKAKRHKAKILVLTVDGNEKNIAQAFINGADGYILKDICPEELAEVMLSAYNGLDYIHESAFNIRSIRLSADPPGTDNPNAQLRFTAREKEVLELVIEGMTNEEISEILGISVGRTRNIVTDLISKSMVKNRKQLAVIAVKTMTQSAS